MKKLTKKKLDAAIDGMFKVHGHRRQFPIFDLGKIADAGRSAYDAAATHEDGLKAADAAVAVACDRYEVKPAAAKARGGGELAHPDPCVADALQDAASEDPGGPADALDFRIPGLVF